MFHIANFLRNLGREAPITLVLQVHHPNPVLCLVVSNFLFFSLNLLFEVFLFCHALFEFFFEEVSLKCFL